MSDAAAPTIFPPEAYSQGDQFQREKRGLFGRAWLPFCAAGQVLRSGEFVQHTFGGWPLFALRGGDGVLRAFHNVCRHQGMPVLEKPAGRCEQQIRCRYHGWTYDLAGALVAWPEQMAPKDPAGIRLPEVKLAEAAGLVFVALQPREAAPVKLELGGGSLAAEASTDVACNWKTFVEAALADPGWRYEWPVAFQRDVDGARLIRLVVPRSFSRTRLVDLLFGKMAGAEALRAEAAEAKSRAEQLQERRAAAAMPAENAAVAEFRGRVAAAL